MDIRLAAASRRSTDKVPAIIRVQASPFIRPSIHPPIARSHMTMTRENHPFENETEGERERRLTRGSTDGGRRFSLGQKWWRGQASLRRSPCSERYDGRRRAMRGVSLRVLCRGSGGRSCGFVECECKCEWGQQRGGGGSTEGARLAFSHAHRWPGPAPSTANRRPTGTLRCCAPCLIRHRSVEVGPLLRPTFTRPTDADPSACSSIEKWTVVG